MEEFTIENIYVGCSTASIGFIVAGKGIAEVKSCVDYFEARALALVIICVLCLGEADGANHRPSIEDEPSVCEVVGEPSEIVAAYGTVYHGIPSKFAEEYSVVGAFMTSETDS